MYGKYAKNTIDYGYKIDFSIEDSLLFSRIQQRNKLFKHIIIFVIQNYIKTLQTQRFCLVIPPACPFARIFGLFQLWATSSVLGWQLIHQSAIDGVQHIIAHNLLNATL